MAFWQLAERGSFGVITSDIFLELRVFISSDTESIHILGAPSVTRLYFSSPSQPYYLLLLKSHLLYGRCVTFARDNLIFACYLINPYVLLSSLGLSTSSLENMFVLLVVLFSSHGLKSVTLLLMAVLTHISPSYNIILPSIAMLSLLGPNSRLADPYKPNIRRLSLVLSLGQFMTYFILLTVASSLASGNWSWISQTWGASFLLPDLTPNPGLWWYYFTEMFDHFRPFFLMVFSVHLLIYTLPFCIKFQYDPLYATFCLLGILGIFKPYPTLADAGLFTSMIAIFPEIYSYFRHPLVTTILHLHASLLMPLFHNLWLQQGTGNANFFYASTLVFACANGAAVIDCVWAGITSKTTVDYCLLPPASGLTSHCHSFPVIVIPNVLTRTNTK
ncbi:hypothetical protein APHAL10511_003642 [Amanita phalloides]|nr:hypothetical protein APHAL10511_003642 [Amanita phalloides]